MVARIQDEKKLLGVRLFDTDTFKFKDAELSKVIESISSGRVHIENLKVEDGSLKGVNGSIERYGIVGESDSLTIIGVFKDNYGKALGYRLVDTGQNYCRYGPSTAIAYNYTDRDIVKHIELARANRGNMLGLANGKITGKGWSRYVSAIDGRYDTLRIIRRGGKEEKLLKAFGAATFDGRCRYMANKLFNALEGIRAEDARINSELQFTVRWNNVKVGIGLRRGIITTYNMYTNNALRRPIKGMNTSLAGILIGESIKGDKLLDTKSDYFVPWDVGELLEGNSEWQSTYGNFTRLWDNSISEGDCRYVNEFNRENNTIHCLTYHSCRNGDYYPDNPTIEYLVTYELVRGVPRDIQKELFLKESRHLNNILYKLIREFDLGVDIDSKIMERT